MSVSKRILDKDITLANYGAFRKCVITSDGKKIKFLMTGSASYVVIIRYFLSWYKEPHYIYYNGRWIKPDKAIKKNGFKSLKFYKWRRIQEGRAVKIYLNNNTAYIVPWDTVLMACERRYEHFGGLTKESKKLAHKFV